MNLSYFLRESQQLIYLTMTRHITGDPGAKHVVVRRGRKRVQRETRHSKSLISVMLAGIAAGKFLPPMVVYKSENKYENWV